MSSGQRFGQFITQLTVPVPKRTNDFWQRQSTTPTPKLQFHMNLISQEPQPGDDLFDTLIKGGGAILRKCNLMLSINF